MTVLGTVLSTVLSTQQHSVLEYLVAIHALLKSPLKAQRVPERVLFAEVSDLAEIE